MSTPANNLIGRLSIVYGAPPAEQPVAWIAEVTRLIASYSAAECERAFDLIVKTHRSKSYPALSEIITACADARTILSAKKPVDASAWDRARRDREALARKMVTTTEAGHKALRDGWHQGLYEFARDHGRMPKGQEQARIIETTRLIDDVASGVRSVPVYGPALRALATSIQERRAKLAADLMGKEARDAG